jgi:hypothetical protein
LSLNRDSTTNQTACNANVLNDSLYERKTPNTKLLIYTWALMDRNPKIHRYINLHAVVVNNCQETKEKCCGVYSSSECQPLLFVTCATNNLFMLT